MIVLDEANKQGRELIHSRVSSLLGTSSIYTIALPSQSKEVGKIELNPDIIKHSIQEGFAVAYELLQSDITLKQNGRKIANEIWK